VPGLDRGELDSHLIETQTHRGVPARSVHHRRETAIIIESPRWACCSVNFVMSLCASQVDFTGHPHFFAMSTSWTSVRRTSGSGSIRSLFDQFFRTPVPVGPTQRFESGVVDGRCSPLRRFALRAAKASTLLTRLVIAEAAMGDERSLRSSQESDTNSRSRSSNGGVRLQLLHLRLGAVVAVLLV
jgi:hypothetical protein